MPRAVLQIESLAEGQSRPSGRRRIGWPNGARRPGGLPRRLGERRSRVANGSGASLFARRYHGVGRAPLEIGWVRPRPRSRKAARNLSTRTRQRVLEISVGRRSGSGRLPMGRSPRRLRLLHPEAHGYLAIHGYGLRQPLPGRPAIAEAAIELAKSEGAVGVSPDASTFLRKLHGSETEAVQSLFPDSVPGDPRPPTATECAARARPADVWGAVPAPIPCIVSRNAGRTSTSGIDSCNAWADPLVRAGAPSL